MIDANVTVQNEPFLRFLAGVKIYATVVDRKRSSIISIDIFILILKKKRVVNFNENKNRITTDTFVMYKDAFVTNFVPIAQSTLVFDRKNICRSVSQFFGILPRNLRSSRSE